MQTFSPIEFREEIVKYCLENGTEENVIRYSRFFKDGFHGYGLTTQQSKDLAKSLFRSQKCSLPIVLEAMPLLLKSGMYEEVGVGLLVLDAFYKQFTEETFHVIGSWYALGIDNWAHADSLAMMVLPRFFIKGMLRLDVFKEWIESPYKFQRRCVPVTCIKMLKTLPSYSGVFEFLEPLMMDPEREVHQGMGWFLREAWKKRPDETENFLLKWKETTPRLIIQYATEKMTPEHKLLFKRTQKKK